MKKYCLKCKTTSPTENEFCGKCGEKLPSEKESLKQFVMDDPILKKECSVLDIDTVKGMLKE